jgi:outer membrane protein OmpA-like peptidoglycan-associated protein
MALALLCAAGASLPSSARAADVPYDINRFAPAFGTGRFVTLDLAEIAPRLEVAPQIFVNYAHNPLYLYIGDKPQFPIIEHRVTGDIGLSVGIPIHGTGRLQFGLALPVTFYQSGNGDMVATMFGGTKYINVLPTQTIKSAGQEDLRFQIKGVFVNGRLGGLGMAGDLKVPTGDKDSFLGNPLPTFNLKLLGHLNFWKFTLALNVGWLFAEDRTIVFTNTGMSFTYGLGLGLKVAKWDSGSFDILTEVYGLSYKDFAHLGEAPVEGTAALRFNIKDWHIYLGAGPGIPPNYAKGIGTPEYRVYAGLQWAWQKKPAPPPPPKEPPPPDCRCKGPNCACTPGVNCPCTPGVNCRCTPGVDCPCTPGKDCACEEGKTCACTPGVDCPCTPGKDCLCSGPNCPKKPIRLRGESFEFDSPELTEDGKQTIRGEIDKLVEHLVNRGGKIRVEGHTDNVGGMDYNTGLSWGRAKSVHELVVALLKEKGVSDEIIANQVLPFQWYSYKCAAVPYSKVKVRPNAPKTDKNRILRDEENEPNRRIEINQYPDEGIKCFIPLPVQQ